MTTIGPKPELRWLPIERMTVDMSYQRTILGRISQRTIDHIEADFSWACFGTILVTPGPAGNFLVIDGQHRLAAVRRRGDIPEVPAVVVEKLNTREQAALFVDANKNRVSVNNLALYHAQVVAGDPRALEIRDIAVSAGIEIARYPIPSSSIKPRVTLAVGAIGQSIAKHGRFDTEAAVIFVAKAVAHIPGRLRADLFRGAARFFASAGKTLSNPGKDAIRALVRNGAGFDRAVDGMQEEGEPRHVAIARLFARTNADVANAVPEAFKTKEAPERQQIVEELRQLEADKTFDEPKQRRCEVCDQIFLAGRVGEVECGQCLEVQARIFGRA